VIRQAKGRVIRQAKKRVIRQAKRRTIRKAREEMISNVSSICVVLILTLDNNNEKLKRVAIKKSLKRLRTMQK